MNQEAKKKFDEASDELRRHTLEHNRIKALYEDSYAKLVRLDRSVADAWREMTGDTWRER